MEELIRVVKELQATTSRLEKERILIENKDNDFIKRVFEFVYNPYIISGISSKKLEKKVKSIGYHITQLDVLMEYLKKNNTGRDIDIATVQGYLFFLTENEKEIVSQIITKSLKIGCTAKTLNKVYGEGFIPEFNVMLAKKYWEEMDKVEGKEFCISTKLDGGRLVGIKENGNISFFTRQGQPMEGLNDIIEELKDFLPDNYVLDGELLLENKDNLPSKDLYRETMKESRKKGIKKNLIFNAFDIIPLEEFRKGKSKDNCFKRKEFLHSLFGKEYKWIKEVEILYKGKDTNKIIELLDEAVANEEEGVMVNLDLPYECKRTDNILKVKKFNEADVRVLGLYEGTGENVGKLGGIEIQFEHEGELYSCNCGSGFSKEERILYWEQPDLLIGKIVTIDYFEVSQDSKTKLYSLRFPTWKGIIRDDKDDISMY